MQDKYSQIADEILEPLTPRIMVFGGGIGAKLDEAHAKIVQAIEAEVELNLDRWKSDIEHGFIPKCSFCGIKSRKVVGQVAKGKSAQEGNHLPRNWGYYCQKCYDEGMELEREAMYG
jgi:hypothetical protein